MKNRIVGLLLVVVFLLGLCASAYAADDQLVSGQQQTAEDAAPQQDGEDAAPPASEEQPEGQSDEVLPIDADGGDVIVQDDSLDGGTDGGVMTTSEDAPQTEAPQDGQEALAAQAEAAALPAESAPAAAAETAALPAEPALMAAAETAAAPVAEITDGWVKQDGEWFYLNARERLSGWQTIGDRQYYFRTGSSREWSAQNGENSLVQGLLWLGGKNWYYFDSDASDPTKTVMVRNGFRLVDGDWSYFGADGKRVTGWQTINGRQYYFRTSSSREWSAQNGEYSMAEGLLWLGGKNWYYFDIDAGDPNSVSMVRNGFRKVDGDWSYFGADGKRVTGWQTINGKQYYFRTSSSREWSAQNGEYSMAEGLLWLGGKNWYYFDSNGSDPNSVSMVHNGFRLVDGDWSYFGADGKRVTGWQTINGKQYYFRTSSSREWSAQNGEYSMAEGLLWLGGKNWYYFDIDAGDPNSVSMVHNGFRMVDGKWSYFGADGKRVTGWQTINGKRYFFNTSGSSEYALAEGLTQIDGKWYCFDRDNGILTGWQDVGGGRYYFDGSGALANGLTLINNAWYSFDSSGQLQTNRTVTLGVKTYSVDANGMVSGFTGSPQAVAVLNQIGWNLKAAYNWAAGLRYANRGYRADSVDAYADYGFTNHYGNCYVMNSCLYKLAQALGYEVRFVSGGVHNSNGYNAPHGWCEINDGGWYVFDSNFHNETGRNGYRISYGQSGTWQYVKYGYLA